jgi:hypothetical protein
MGDLTRASPVVLPLHFSTLHPPALSAFQTSNGQNFSSAVRTWVANLVQYNPVTVPFDYPVQRVFWANGSTTTTTNVQFGIYTADGTLIYATASTTMGTASSLQYVTPSSSFVLSPGRYYFAWTCDNTTSRGFTLSQSTVAQNNMLGLLEETTGAFGLPTTMAGAIRFTRAWGPYVCGVTRTTTGF